MVIYKLPLGGVGFYTTLLLLVFGPLLVGVLAHILHGLPNSRPSPTRLWAVLGDLVDARTRRGTNVTLTLVARIVLHNLHMCVLLKNPS